MKGAVEMQTKLTKLARQYPNEIGGAMYAEEQIDMFESKQRCPVSPVPAPKNVVPGTLRASGTVHEPVWVGKTCTVVMSYGGPGIEYAVVQHENPDFFHTTGQWKYLESVMRESQPHMAARVGRRIHMDRVVI